MTVSKFSAVKSKQVKLGNVIIKFLAIINDNNTWTFKSIHGNNMKNHCHEKIDVSIILSTNCYVYVTMIIKFFNENTYKCFIYTFYVSDFVPIRLIKMLMLNQTKIIIFMSFQKLVSWNKMENGGVLYRFRFNVKYKYLNECVYIIYFSQSFCSSFSAFNACLIANWLYYAVVNKKIKKNIHKMF